MLWRWKTPQLRFLNDEAIAFVARLTIGEQQTFRWKVYLELLEMFGYDFSAKCICIDARLVYNSIPFKVATASKDHVYPALLSYTMC